MFVRTCSLRLCTGSAHVHRALKKSVSGYHIEWNKLDVTITDFVKNHIKCFPTYESQYSRNDTENDYLIPDQNFSLMYRLYTERNFKTAIRHLLIYLNMYDTYMAKITLNMEKSIKQILSKFHFHKLKITCSIDRLYKDTIAFHFHTNARI